MQPFQVRRHHDLAADDAGLIGSGLALLLRHLLLAPPTLGECRHRGLAGLSVPARGSSAADLTTRYMPSHTPSLETDSVGKTRRAPTPGPDTVVAWHSCSCR